MNHRLAGLLTVIAALAALGLACYAQHVLLLTPCELCLWERWPYRVAFILGVLAVLLPRGLGLAALWAAALVFLAGAGLGALHTGVELHWWASPLPECNGTLAPGAPLPLMPARPCDSPVLLIPHFPVSMAAMDFCAALVLALLLFAYLLHQRKAYR